MAAYYFSEIFDHHEYGSSFSEDCVTPATSASVSSFSSRRSSEQLFDSSCSNVASSSECQTPCSPTPSSRGYGLSCYPLESHLYRTEVDPKRSITPSSPRYHSFEGVSGPQLTYLPTTLTCPFGEFKDGNNMETNLHSAATEFSKSVVKWDQMTFDGNLTTSKPVGQNYLFNHAEGFAQHFPWGIEEHDQIDFSNMASFSQGMMDPSPSTILPSQTLRYPSRQPPAVLATPFLSPVKMTTEISIYDPLKLESAGEAASFNFLLDQPISGCSYAPSDFSAVARDGSIPSSSPRERKGQMGNRVQSMEGIKRR